MIGHDELYQMRLFGFPEPSWRLLRVITVCARTVINGTETRDSSGQQLRSMGSTLQVFQSRHVTPWGHTAKTPIFDLPRISNALVH